jgi:hypothetical protein
MRLYRGTHILNPWSLVYMDRLPYGSNGMATATIAWNGQSCARKMMLEILP